MFKQDVTFPACLNIGTVWYNGQNGVFLPPFPWRWGWSSFVLDCCRWSGDIRTTYICFHATVTRVHFTRQFSGVVVVLALVCKHGIGWQEDVLHQRKNSVTDCLATWKNVCLCIVCGCVQTSGKANKPYKENSYSNIAMFTMHGSRLDEVLCPGKIPPWPGKCVSKRIHS